MYARWGVNVFLSMRWFLQRTKSAYVTYEYEIEIAGVPLLDYYILLHKYSTMYV